MITNNSLLTNYANAYTMRGKGMRREKRRGERIATAAERPRNDGWGGCGEGENGLPRRMIARGDIIARGDPSRSDGRAFLMPRSGGRAFLFLQAKEAQRDEWLSEAKPEGL